MSDNQNGDLVDRDTRRNAAFYYLNFVVAALVGFIINPLLLNALGSQTFGIWKSLQKFLDFASVADGRASQALKWIVANRSTLSDSEKRRDIGAAVTVWVRWLPVTTAVAVGVTLAIPLLINGLPDEARHIAYTTAAILAANTILSGLLAIPESVLMGVNQGYKSMIVSTCSFIASNAMMLAVALVGWPLWSLAVIVLAAAALNAAMTLLITRRTVPWWGIARPTKSDSRRVMGYSAWTLGWVAVEKLFISSELIVFSIMLGAVGVTQYTFTSYVMQFVLSISLISASAFMPLLGSQLGASRFDAAASRARTVRHFVVGISTLGSGAVLAFNGLFVTIWAGGDQYLGLTPNTLLVFCGLQLALIRLDGQILDVTMRIAPKVIIGVISSVGGIAAGCIAYALTHSLPISLTSVIAMRMASNLSYPVMVKRAIPGSAVPLRPRLLAMAFLLVSLATGAGLQSGALGVQAGAAGAWAAAFGAVLWLGLLPRETVAALLKGSERKEYPAP